MGGFSVKRRVTILFLMCLLCLGALTGCRPEKIVSTDFAVGPIHLDMPYDEVVALLGQPALEEPNVDGDQHQFIISESVRLTVAADSGGVCSIWLDRLVDGRLLHTGMPAASGDPAKLSIDHLKTPRLLTIGSQISEVTRRYGKPYREPSDTFVEYVLPDTQTFMSFLGTDGRVTTIVISRVTFSDD